MDEKNVAYGKNFLQENKIPSRDEHQSNESEEISNARPGVGLNNEGLSDVSQLPFQKRPRDECSLLPLE